MAASSAHFVVTKDVGGGPVPVAANEQEFIEMTAAGSVFIKPVYTPVDKEGVAIPEDEILELPEWSLGFIGVADKAGTSHDITLKSLMRVDGVGVATSEITQRVVLGGGTGWEYMPVWWGHDTLPPLTFKNEIKIEITGAGPYRVVLRFIPRSHLRGF